VEPHKPNHKTMTRGGQTICMEENCQQYLMPVPPKGPKMGQMAPEMGMGMSPLAMAIGAMSGIV
jgi:hypothetical protein